MKKNSLVLILVLICVSLACLLGACSSEHLTYVFPKYQVTKTEKSTLEKDEDVKIDGVLDEDFWINSKNSYTYTSKVSSDVTMTTMSYISDYGVYFGIVVKDYAVYYNSDRKPTRNSSAEVYVCGFGDNARIYNIRLVPTGVDGERQMTDATWIYMPSTSSYITWSIPWEGACTTQGNINTSTCEGYTCEAFIPWSSLGVQNCGYIRYNLGFNHVETDDVSDGERTWSGIDGTSLKGSGSFLIANNDGFAKSSNPVVLDVPAIHVTDSMKQDGVYKTTVSASSSFVNDSLLENPVAVDAEWSFPEGINVARNDDNTVSLSIAQDKIQSFKSGLEYSVSYMGITKKGEVLYAPISLDGNLDDSYGGKLTRTNANGVSQTTHAKIAERGMYVMIEVIDGNIGQETHTETYFTFADTFTIDNAWQIRYFPTTKTFRTYTYTTPDAKGFAWKERTGNKKLDANIVCNMTDVGYNVEIYVSYNALGLTEKPNSVNLLNCFAFYKKNATSRTVVDGNIVIDNYHVHKIENFSQFDENGYVRKSINLDNVVISDNDIVGDNYVKEFSVTDDEHNAIKGVEFNFLDDNITALANGNYQISIPVANKSQFASPYSEIIVVDNNPYTLYFEIFNASDADAYVSYNGTVSNQGTNSNITASAQNITGTGGSFTPATNVNYTTGVDGSTNSAIVNNTKTGTYTYLSGTGIKLGTNDFTISTWINIASSEKLSTGNGNILFASNNLEGANGVKKGSSGFYLTLRQNTDGNHMLQFSYSGDTSSTKNATVAFERDQWYLVTMVRTGTSLKIYFNETVVYSTTLKENADLGSTQIAFGGFSGEAWSYADSDIVYDETCYFARALNENHIKVLCQALAK